MVLNGGKRKANKSLKAWVAFVKKVQKEEKLSYKDAIHRAKQRKDKGEKWMTGGKAVNDDTDEMEIEESEKPEENNDNQSEIDFSHIDEEDFVPIRNEDTPPSSPRTRGGKKNKKRKTNKKRSSRKNKSRKSYRH